MPYTERLADQSGLGFGPGLAGDYGRGRVGRAGHDTPASGLYVNLRNPLDPPILSCAWILSATLTRRALVSAHPN